MQPSEPTKLDTLANLLKIFGVNSYKKEDLSFMHKGSNYIIDANKLAGELL